MAEVLLVPIPALRGEVREIHFLSWEPRVEKETEQRKGRMEMALTFLGAQ